MLDTILLLLSGILSSAIRVILFMIAVFPAYAAGAFLLTLLTFAFFFGFGTINTFTAAVDLVAHNLSIKVGFYTIKSAT